MTPLLTIADKGSPLTPQEADDNISTLQTKTGDGWADIVTELFTRSSPQSVAVGQFLDGIYLYEFPPGDNHEAFANFHIPHAWKPGTMLYPHFHFSVKTNNSGVVRWGFEYTSARRHDTATGQFVFPNTVTLYQEFVIDANSAYEHFVSEMPELGGVPGTGLEVDAMVLSRVFRDGLHGNDTFPDNIYGITVDLHIEVDRHATPQRAPDFYTP